jgi:hypothetical protein
MTYHTRRYCTTWMVGRGRGKEGASSIPLAKSERGACGSGAGVLPGE